ncbi:MAG: hypothetical protein AAFR61_15230 [Bacteroidota bacterium]
MRQQKRKLILWLKFRPEHAQTKLGTAKFHEPYKHHYQKARLMEKLLLLAQKHREAGRIWQFRIYDQPGNNILESWAQYQNSTD